jgi:NADH-quinone oxidoreductase subunit M
MMYERRHTREIAAFGGIARVAPFFATAFMITALASIGVPGTSGFIGEFLALLGAFETHRTLAIIAGSGVIFAAYYMLPMVQKVFFNKLEKPENREMKDLSAREMAILAPMCALMIIIGWNPTPILRRMEATVQTVLERVEAAAPATRAADTVAAPLRLDTEPIHTTDPHDAAGEAPLAADDE